MKIKEIDSEQVITARFDGFIVETVDGTFEIVSATTIISTDGLPPTITMSGYSLRKDGNRKASQTYSMMLRVSSMTPASYAPFDAPWAWQESFIEVMVEAAKEATK